MFPLGKNREKERERERERKADGREPAQGQDLQLNEE